MKNIARVLRQATATAVITFTVSASYSQDVNNCEAIEKFFISSIEGDTATFHSDRKVKLKNVERTGETIWRLWQNANILADEQKLPALCPIEVADSSHWNIPASLEPDASMPFYWVNKGNGIPTKGLPMFLYLHGSGSKEHEWPTGLRLARRFNDGPSVYFIPQIPNEGEYYRWWQRSKQYTWNRLLRQALASGQVDPDKVYIFGISEGGYGSQRLASFYADYLAAAGPMAGGEPLKNAPAENLLNTAFSLRTGDQDFGFYRDKLTRYTGAAIDSLQRLWPEGYIHNVELIPGMGHHIDYTPTTPWMLQYTRDPYPRHVIWENFEMDGLYRSGFYNLYVNERSNTDENTRTRYDLTINGNSVDLQVSEVTYTTTETDSRWGIALAFARSYKPATKGRVTIYLNDKLVDLKRPVTVTVNGTCVFSGKVTPRLADMVNSCARFFDPARIYPVAIEAAIH